MEKIKKLKKYKEFKDLKNVKTTEIEPGQGEAKPAEVFDIESMEEIGVGDKVELPTKESKESKEEKDLKKYQIEYTYKGTTNTMTRKFKNELAAKDYFEENYPNRQFKNIYLLK